MSTTSHVTAAEIEEWIGLVYDLAEQSEARDIAGGIAPATIVERAETDRHVSTVLRHLQRDARVESTRGIHRDGTGGRRLSFLPAREEFERLVADGGVEDIRVCRLNVAHAIEQAPEGRAKEHLREAAQLLKAEEVDER